MPSLSTQGRWNKKKSTPNKHVLSPLYIGFFVLLAFSVWNTVYQQTLLRDCSPSILTTKLLEFQQGQPNSSNNKNSKNKNNDKNVASHNNNDDSSSSLAKPSLREAPALREGGVIDHMTSPLTTSASMSGSLDVPLRNNSSDATVMAMSHGYNLLIHKRFVGSLRKSGFTGHIFMATEPRDQMKEGVADYFDKMNVTVIELQFMECNNPIIKNVTGELKGKQKEANTCVAPYPDVKVRWGRYPMLRDVLKNCTTCTGPVLFSDARDTFFQRDPFGDGAAEIQGFHFFGEHRSVDAEHFFVARRVRICKQGYKMKGPQLCSGTTIGTRETMLKFLDIMYEEMKLWMITDTCYFESHGGDQAIMNYLYYDKRFNELDPHVFMARHNGIVNTVGRVGHMVSKANHRGYKSYTGEFPNWLMFHLDMTDEQGYFIEYDGSRSRVIHQWDRFGLHLQHWLDKPGYIYD